MRFFMTLTLVLFLTLSLTLGCKQKSEVPANNQVSENNDADAGGGANATDDSGAGGDMAGGSMDDDPTNQEMDDDPAEMAGDEGFDPAEEDDGLSGLDGTGDPGDIDGTGDPALEGDDGLSGLDGTGDPGDIDGTGDPANAGGGQRGAQRKPATFLEGSKQSFSRSENRSGFNYAFAALLTDQKAAPELLTQYQWVPALRRPALGVRWGIGIQFIGTKEAATKPYPIGTEQKMPEKGSSRRNQGDNLGSPDDVGGDLGLADDGLTGGFGGGNGQGGSDLKKYTGELGEKVVQRLQARIERGYYGSVLKSAMADGGSRGGQEGSFAGGNTGGFDPADDAIDDPAGAGFDPAGGGGNGRRGAANQGMPTGVTMLGVGKLEALAVKAQQAELDAVIIFEVKVAVNRRTKLVTNNTTLQLFDVREGKVVKKNKSALNNVKVQMASEKAKGDEVNEMIEKEIDQIFLGPGAADAIYRVKELPALTAENVLEFRITPMVKEDYQNPLPVLAELHFWLSRQLLKPDHLAIAYKELLGEDIAEKLLKGDEKTKAEVVKTWLPGGSSDRERESTPFR